MKKLFIILLLSTIVLSDIIVKAPEELKMLFNNTPIKASLSNFGRIPYGYNLVGRLHYDPLNDDAEMACKDVSSIVIKENQSVDEAPIVMVHR
jgi:hypothetical protein